MEGVEALIRFELDPFALSNLLHSAGVEKSFRWAVPAESIAAPASFFFCARPMASKFSKPSIGSSASDYGRWLD